MDAYILDDLVKVPGVVTKGYVLMLGSLDRQVVFLLDGATYAEALEWGQHFSRNSGFQLKHHPLQLGDYNEMVMGLREALNGDNRI
jgi:hypothetical protein